MGTTRCVRSRVSSRRRWGVAMPDGFFGMTRRGERWAFSDPRGEPFFSLGLNHADETNLKYASNIDVWCRRYGSRAAWISEGVVRDFEAWGFNTIGWTSEFVSGSKIDG